MVIRPYNLRVTSVNLFLVFILCLAPFVIWPELDLIISGLFFHQDNAFWLGTSFVGFHLRNFIHQVMLLVGFFGLVGLAISFFRDNPMGIPNNDWWFVSLLYVIGPGLFVNYGFKEFWGRARPRQILEFGGDLQFTPVYQISDQCDFNCSFSSGEGAGATAMALSIWVLTAGMKNTSLKKVLRAGIATLAIIGICLRVVFGAHFTSDTLFSIFFVTGIALGLAYYFRPSGLTSE